MKRIFMEGTGVTVVVPGNVEIVVLAVKDGKRDMEKMCFSSDKASRIAFPIIAIAEELERLERESKRNVAALAIKEIAKACGLNVTIEEGE